MENNFKKIGKIFLIIILVFGLLVGAYYLYYYFWNKKISTLPKYTNSIEYDISRSVAGTVLEIQNNVIKIYVDDKTTKSITINDNTVYRMVNNKGIFELTKRDSLKPKQTVNILLADGGGSLAEKIEILIVN